MNDYDIGRAFEEIEDELTESMIRNMRRHRVDEVDEKKQWSQWQAEQLKALEQYRKQNKEKFSGRFRDINGYIDKIIEAARAEGNMDQELEIMEAIKNGFRGYKKQPEALAGEFFKLNDRKLEALIQATKNDFTKGEHAILRMSNDRYRKIIFNAQVYANTGAGTYEKAVDMATKDFIAAGINCIEYKNGARHTMKDYADMAIRTATKRAYLTGEGEKRNEWGIHTVIVNKRNSACPLCVPFCGKILIDDVYSGGNASEGNYPLMSSAMAAGFLHPRCKDIYTTYFEGISTPPKKKWTQEELDEIEGNARKEEKQTYAKYQADRMGRLAKHTLDPDNKKIYEKRADQWENRQAEGIVKRSSNDIIKNIEVPEDISNIGGMTEETEEAIRAAFKKIKSEYDVRVDEITTESLGSGNERVPFQFVPKNVGGFLETKIVTNKDYYFNDSLGAYTARIMRNHDSGALAAQSIEDLIAHEMAHVMTFQDCEKFSVFERVEEEVRGKFIKGLSAYADSTFDGAETIAEAFVRKRNKEKLPENVENLLEKYIERWKR